MARKKIQADERVIRADERVKNPDEREEEPARAGSGGGFSIIRETFYRQGHPGLYREL